MALFPLQRLYANLSVMKLCGWRFNLEPGRPHARRTASFLPASSGVLAARPWPGHPNGSRRRPRPGGRGPGPVRVCAVSSQLSPEDPESGRSQGARPADSPPARFETTVAVRGMIRISPIVQTATAKPAKRNVRPRGSRANPAPMRTVPRGMRSMDRACITRAGVHAQPDHAPTICPGNQAGENLKQRIQISMVIGTRLEYLPIFRNVVIISAAATVRSIPFCTSSSSLSGVLSALPQLGRLFMVTPEAQGPKVGQIALSPTLSHRQDVVGIPEAPPATVHVQLTPQLPSLACRQALKPAIEFGCVQAANRADTPIASPYLPAQVPRVCSQPPLMNAGITAESPPSLRHFYTAPPADSSAICSPLRGPTDPASWFLSVRAHAASARHQRRIRTRV